MKIKLTICCSFIRGRLLHLIMKTFIFLLCTTVFSFNVEKSFSQEKVTIDRDQLVKVDRVFKIIHKQTDFDFIYPKGLFKNKPKVLLKKGEILAADLVKICLENAGLNFEISETNTVIIKNTPKETSPALKEDKMQGVQVSGVVTDLSGQPLPGANILEKGTANGTQTDFDGKFSLNVADENAILVVSYLGFATKEITVGNQTDINISLEEDASSLDEVVVVGYGTVKKSDLTGAVSTVKAEDLPVATTTSVEQLLSAQAAGVQITQTSAQPGGGVNIVIRGRPSTGAGNQPLYVIDGFPVSGGVEPGSSSQFGNAGSRSPLNDINPNDIESIEILKDASSTSIYGARAANGVVLITTKRGKTGAPKVEISSSYSFQNVAELPDALNAREYMTVVNEILQERHLRNNDMVPFGTNAPTQLEFNENPFAGLRYTQAQIDAAGEGTDWFDVISRSGYIQQQNVNISGGNEKTKYLTSFNYFDQEGVIRGSGLKRYSLRVNLDQKISERINLGLSFTASKIDNDNLPLGGSDIESAPPLIGALGFNPTVSPRDENGLGGYGLHDLQPSLWPNPLSLIETLTDQTTTNRILANTFVTFKIIDELSATARFGIDRSTGERNSFTPSETTIVGNQVGGIGEKRLVTKEDYLVNFLLNYNKEFGKHSLSALAGYEYQQFNRESFSARNDGFISDGLLFNDLGSGTGTQAVGSGKSLDELASYFGRINYNYDDKYLLTLSIRHDGSPKFGANNRWGTFPSAAFKWRVINESFLSNSGPLSDLGLRVGYGTTGNSNIGGNAQAIFQANASYAFGIGGGIARNLGVRQTQLANPDLKWETTTELNLGLDFGLFNNGLTGTFEYFNKEVSDLLDRADLAPFLPINSVAANIGITESKGWELTLNSRNISGENFRWTTSFNISRFEDRWKERNPNNIIPVHLKEDDLIRPIYTHVPNGILQVGEAAPEAQPGLQPGALKLLDWNGIDSEGNLTGEADGLITDADLVFQGSQDPGYVYGIGNNLSYKNFDLHFFFQGMADRLRFNDIRSQYAVRQAVVDLGNNGLREIQNRWTPDNPNATIPSSSVNTSTGNLFLEDGSFLRLRNVTLGYNIPQDALGNLFSKARIYFDAQNLFVITDYTGIDPEFDARGAYPNSRSFTFGVNLTF